ncbi:hypothetical protein B0H11DRAFT_2121205 [Mycena galericulata]|nr:hypothetical protein B0H11DRAFT_2121205 [Mycena galericulata]
MLPLEMVHEIAERSTRSSLLALSRVGNHQIHTICVPYLFKTVEISDPCALLAFCSALSSDAQLAKLVKSLTIKFECTSTAGAVEREKLNYYIRREARCATVISGLHQLVNLDIVHPITLFPQLKSGFFPHLRTLVTSFSNSLEPFLQKHRFIDSLHVIPSPTGSSTQLSSMCLPTLRNFSGPANVARAIVPGSCVANPTVYWPRSMMATEKAITFMRSLAHSHVPIQTLKNVIVDWKCDPFVIAAALPTITRLSFVPHGVDQAGRPAFLMALGMSIALSCKRLRTVRIHLPPDVTQATLDLEWAFLQVCMQSETLESCILFSGTYWARLRSPNVWAPANDFDFSPAFLRWFRGRIIREGVVVLPDYLPILERLLEDNPNWDGEQDD